MIDIYVSETGDDTGGNGTIGSPYKTIAKALSVLNDNANIYLGEGVYQVFSLIDMSSSSYVVNYYGTGYKTIVELRVCYTSVQFRNQMTVSKCWIRPINGFTGDTRTMSYTNDNINITFNFVLFTKSLSNAYPTSGLFYLHNNVQDFVTNKVFNYCTFIYPGSQPIQSGAATFNRCVTNYSSFSISAYSGLTSCLVSQSFNSYYELNDIISNNSYGVYAGWRDIRMLLVIGDDYYTIINKEIVKASPRFSETFNSIDMIGVNIDKFKYAKAKLLIFRPDTKNYASLTYPLDNYNAFVLISLDNPNLNIKLKNPHKMIVSNDLLTWDNYYDGKVSSTITIDDYDNKINYLKGYIRYNSKPIDYIDSGYKYILMQLNNGDNLDKIYEIVKADYIRFEPDITLYTGVDKNITVTVPFNTQEVIIKTVASDINIIQNSLGE